MCSEPRSGRLYISLYVCLYFLLNGFNTGYSLLRRSIKSNNLRIYMLLYIMPQQCRHDFGTKRHKYPT